MVTNLLRFGFSTLTDEPVKSWLARSIICARKAFFQEKEKQKQIDEDVDNCSRHDIKITRSPSLVMGS